MDENNEKFNSLNELYERVLPALKTKVAEFKRAKISFINANDIWNYCLYNIWKNRKDLRIYEIVDDILNADAFNIEIYVRKIKNKE